MGDVFLVLPRDVTGLLEEKLAKMAKANPDNHTVYQVTDILGGEPFYIRFSDFSATFGHSVREGHF